MGVANISETPITSSLALTSLDQVAWFDQALLHQVPQSLPWNQIPAMTATVTGRNWRMLVRLLIGSMQRGFNKTRATKIQSVKCQKLSLTETFLSGQKLPPSLTVLERRNMRRRPA